MRRVQRFVRRRRDALRAQHARDRVPLSSDTVSPNNSTGLTEEHVVGGGWGLSRRLCPREPGSPHAKLPPAPRRTTDGPGVRSPPAVGDGVGPTTSPAPTPAMTTFAMPAPALPSPDAADAAQQYQRYLLGGAMGVAPLLFTASSFFWSAEGQYGITGGTLLVFGSVAWVVAFAGLFGLLRGRTPRYAAAGYALAVYGAICGGVAFALQDLFTALHGVSHEAALRALGDHPVVANAIFWVGGPAFPLSLAVLGVVLARTRVAAPWAGTMLALGGALFPVARIPRLAIAAHAVDLLLLVPMWYIGWQVLRGERHGESRA